MRSKVLIKDYVHLVKWKFRQHLKRDPSCVLSDKEMDDDFDTLYKKQAKEDWPTQADHASVGTQFTQQNEFRPRS